MTSFGELTILWVRKSFSDTPFIFLGRDIVWMTTAANLVIFSIAGSCLFVLRRWRQALTLGRYSSILLLIAFSSVLLGAPGLHQFAAVVLAVGLTVACARAIVRREAKLVALVASSFVFVAATAALLGIGFPLIDVGVEARRVRQMPPAAQHASNILLITLDTVRARNLSLYGYSRQTTPHLDRMASRGVVFDNAIATTSWTLPSHASMFTGRMPRDLSADWLVPLDGRWPTLAEALVRRGYATGGFVANTTYGSYEFGLDRGSLHYEDYSRSPGQLVLSSTLGRTLADSAKVRRLLGYWHVLGRKSAGDINRDFVAWMSRIDDRPFFAFLNYFDAHEPLDPPPPFDRRFGSPVDTADVTFNGTHFAEVAAKFRLSPSRIQAQIDAYDDAIAYEDELLDQLFATLAARGKLANTIVIVTADHGEEFGEHRVFGHGTSLYLDVLHVPLFVMFPGHVPPGRRVGTPVSLVDLPATILDLAGVADGSPFPGVSLAHLWNAEGQSPGSGEPVVSELRGTPRFNPLEREWANQWYPSTKGPMRSVIAEERHYIRRGDGGEELYDLARDRAERTNLAHAEAQRQHLENLRAIACGLAPCAAGDR